DAARVRFLALSGRPPCSTLFPYTTLFRSLLVPLAQAEELRHLALAQSPVAACGFQRVAGFNRIFGVGDFDHLGRGRHRLCPPRRLRVSTGCTRQSECQNGPREHCPARGAGDVTVHSRTSPRPRLPSCTKCRRARRCPHRSGRTPSSVSRQSWRSTPSAPPSAAPIPGFPCLSAR